MRKFLFIFLHFVWVLTTQGQTVSMNCKQYLTIADSIYASNPDSSFTLSCLAEKCGLEKKDSLIIAKSYTNKSKYFLLKSMLEEAGIELNKAYNLYSIKKDTLGLAYVLKLRSILLERVDNHEESLRLLEQSYGLYKRSKNYKNMYSVLLNLSSRYTLTNMLDKAKRCFEELDSLKEYQGTTNIYYYNQNKGIFEVRLKNYKVAEEYLTIAWKFAHEKKMIDSEATILTYLGQNSRLSGDLKQAEEYLLSSEKIGKENALDHELLEAYDEIIMLYNDAKDFKKAFDYQKLKEELSKKLMNLERVNKIAALEKKLALSEKQKEVDLEKVHTEEEQNKSKRLIAGMIGTGIIALLLVFLFIRTRKLKNKIHEKSVIVEEKQREILDSIHYAKRIQRALLTPETYIKKYLNDFFILYKPKDIVSGDFYWSVYYENKFYLAVADCTGHGVPGAFMSMIGINLLNEIIIERRCSNPGLILDIMREEVIRNLNAEGAEEESRDGMDIVLFKIDLQTKQIEFAGANNSLYVLHSNNNELKEYKGNKMPVGKHMDHIDSFDRHNLQLTSGDILYLFTDGYPDQFGGPKGKKFKYKQLEELLHKNAHLPMNMQRETLNLAFEEWRTDYEQVDDVCIIGIRL
ncbi:MAG: SpoIIE family protein phosphatase [Bacteroidota bacterium]|nr:SpoIIE family protein phosphatase [Bacteroidota bacterium]